MPDALWADCRALLPPEKAPGTCGRPPVPFRRVLDGILHVLRTGCQWKAVPREFGSGSTRARPECAASSVATVLGQQGEPYGPWDQHQQDGDQTHWQEVEPQAAQNLQHDDRDPDYG
jgi:transposase